MDVSLGTLIGQLAVLFAVLLLGLLLVRFILAATRLMNRKAEQIEQAASGQDGRNSSEE